ncbi:MAG: hypothetical protein CV089_12170 [Nitrospira sp. WS110]|nr:hypothetical protein [Nitrospira sp. WS110]
MIAGGTTIAREVTESVHVGRPSVGHQVWFYFLHRELSKAVIAGDPMFQPFLADTKLPQG